MSHTHEKVERWPQGSEIRALNKGLKLFDILRGIGYEFRSPIPADFLKKERGLRDSPFSRFLLFFASRKDQAPDSLSYYPGPPCTHPTFSDMYFPTTS